MFTGSITNTETHLDISKPVVAELYLECMIIQMLQITKSQSFVKRTKLSKITLEGSRDH